MSRTSNALKSLTFAVPHLAGAIDLLAVQHPDGTIKISPFYVRFGKYTKLRSKDAGVCIAVNGAQLSFSMQLGRTGEAYFVEETEEVLPEDAGIEEEVLSGMIAGYSDEDEPLAAGDRSSVSPKETSGARSDVKRSCSEPALTSLVRRNSPEAKIEAAVAAVAAVEERKLEEQREGAAQRDGADLVFEAAPEAAESTEAATPGIMMVRESEKDAGAAAGLAAGTLLFPETPTHQDDAAAPLISSTGASPSDHSQTEAAAKLSQSPSRGGEKSVEGGGGGGSSSLIPQRPPLPPLPPPKRQHQEEQQEGPSAALMHSLARLQGAGGGPSAAAGPTAPTATLALSLCWHLLSPSLAPEEVASIFTEHRIASDAFLTGVGLQAQQEERVSKTSIFADPRLACRLGDHVLSFSTAQSLVFSALCFGAQTAETLSSGLPAAAAYALPPRSQPLHAVSLSRATAGAAGSPTSAEQPEGGTPRSGSWREWLTLGWSGGQQQAETPAAGAAAVKGKLPHSVSTASAASSDQMVPPDQEMALLTEAAMGQASHAEVIEMRGIRRSPSGSRTVVLRKRAFVPADEHLPELASALREGQNGVSFSFGKQTLHAFIYLVRWDHRLIISDIDGTITKSDVLGHLGQLLGWDWTHSGVASLFSAVAQNGYGFLYLSSRSIAQASSTRDYLHSLNQDGAAMPQGPVIISPDGLFPSLYREVVLRRPQEFKIRCLEDIKSLFPAGWSPFVAGFGNRDTDEISYLAVGIPASRIFIINPKGELRRASSTAATSSMRSLSAIKDLVDSMFPALSPGGDAAAQQTDTPPLDQFNDYNFWRVPVSYVIDDEAVLFEDALGGSGFDEMGSTASSTAAAAAAAVDAENSDSLAEGENKAAGGEEGNDSAGGAVAAVKD